MTTSSAPPDTEKSAQMANPLLAERRRAERAEEALRQMRVVEVEPQSLPARMMRSRTGQLGALAGAIAVVMVPCASIVTAWMDVTKLRAELLEERTARIALQGHVDAIEAWQRDVIGPWRGSVDAWRTAESTRDQWRDRVLCRTGNKPAWELGWTCPEPKRWSALRE